MRAITNSPEAGVHAPALPAENSHAQPTTHPSSHFKMGDLTSRPPLKQFFQYQVKVIIMARQRALGVSRYLPGVCQVASSRLFTQFTGFLGPAYECRPESRETTRHTLGLSGRMRIDNGKWNWNAAKDRGTPRCDTTSIV